MSNYYVANQDALFSGFMDGCIVWWRSEGHGYTTDLNDAGVFTEAHRDKNYPPAKCLWIPCEAVDAISKTKRLAWYRDFPQESVEAVKTQVRAAEGAEGRR